VIEIESGNPNFHVKDGFLIATKENCIVHYFGSLDVVTIPANVKAIGESAFHSCGSVERFDFEDSGDGCELELIGEDAFVFCESLESINVPPSVIELGPSCFDTCRSLRTVTFAGDCKLELIRQSAFLSCSSIESFVVPSSVRFIGQDCFHGCDALRNFVLASPSHLEVLLDLPPDWRGFQDIPDSVEILGFSQGYEKPREYTLNFGNESKLRRIVAFKHECVGHAFLRVSSGSVKTFRSDQ
jgi:hypothetical protein